MKSSKYNLKVELLKQIPTCPSCGCKMTAKNPQEAKRGMLSHSAILVDNNTRLICYQCHRILVKKREFATLSLKTRFIKRLDEYTNIVTLFKRWRGKINKCYYVHILGNSLKN